jgi:hypothetical protein
MPAVEPSLELVSWAGLAVVALLVTVGTLTLGESIYRRIGDRRRDAVQSDVRFEILERMSDESPDWETWVAGLSEVERDVARTELDTYLRSTEGEEHRRLRELGDALGIASDARATVSDGKRHEKLRALTWLALLDEPVDPATLRRSCTGDSDLRAAAARVLHEAGHPDARSAGTDLLLGDGQLTLSVYGLDTLHQLHRDSPTPLLERAATAYTDWRPSLIIQVLAVLRYCGPGDRQAPREWIVELTDHELPAVRAAAVTALEPEGWRPELRETVDVQRLVTDSDPATRQAVYGMLAEWGDATAREHLADAARLESDQRARIRALEPLSTRPDLASPDVTEGDAGRYERAWRWVRANARLEADQ